MAVSSQDIELDSLFWMPESGETTFSISFEPIPLNTKAFDFVESDCDDCFQVLGIDLTSELNYSTYALEKPEITDADTIPAPVFKNDSTTLNIKFLGFDPREDRKIELWINDTWGNNHEYESRLDDNGQATISFIQSGVASCRILYGNHIKEMLYHFVLMPGENIEVISQPITMIKSLLLFKKRNAVCKTNNIERVTTTGTFSKINYLTNSLSYIEKYHSLNNSYVIMSYQMSAKECIDALVSHYNSTNKKIENAKLPKLTAELMQHALCLEVLYRTTYCDENRMSDYMHKNNLQRPIRYEVLDPITQEELARITKLFDVTNPLFFSNVNNSDFTMSIFDKQLFELLDIQSGILKQLYDCQVPVLIAKNGELDEDLISFMKEKGYDFALDLCEKYQKETQEKLAAVEGKYKIEETPKVAPEKLFDAIVAPYKDRVVFVDFWNTWCGPCRQSMRELKPIKEEFANNPDVVWVIYCRRNFSATNLSDNDSRHSRSSLLAH